MLDEDAHGVPDLDDLAKERLTEVLHHGHVFLLDLHLEFRWQFLIVVLEERILRWDLHLNFNLILLPASYLDWMGLLSDDLLQGCRLTVDLSVQVPQELDLDASDTRACLRVVDVKGQLRCGALVELVGVHLDFGLVVLFTEAHEAANFGFNRLVDGALDELGLIEDEEVLLIPDLGHTKLAVASDPLALVNRLQL